MGKLFGTDGVRGRVNEYPMTVDTVMNVGRAVVFFFRKESRRPRLIIGKDTRLSGPMFENALSAGICSAGGDALLIEDPIPTPAVAFLTRELRAEAGVVISASHNPFSDNGIKIFSGDGFKLSDEKEREIEELVLPGKGGEKFSADDEIGRIKVLHDAHARYVDFLKYVFPKDDSLEGLTMVLDCANGSTFMIAPRVFSQLGAQIHTYFNEPDGYNINRHCGALYPEGLANKVIEHRADIGFAFDGDGDRMIAVNERGRSLTGDQVLAICAVNKKKAGSLRNNLLVTTVMSNIGLGLAMREEKITHLQTGVGDRYVLEEMRKRGAVIGGENSGHMIFLEVQTTGDGIVSALQLLSVMKSERKMLSELSEVMVVYPQKLISVAVKKQPELNGVPEIAEAVRRVEKALGDKGRVLVRYSGTEPQCRIMVEGPTPEETDRHCRQIADVVRSTLA